MGETGGSLKGHVCMSRAEDEGSWTNMGEQVHGRAATVIRCRGKGEEVEGVTNRGGVKVKQKRLATVVRSVQKTVDFLGSMEPTFGCHGLYR